MSTTQFVGKLDNTDLHEINSKIDYKKTKLKDRKEIVENIVEGSDFFPMYFDNHFKVSINSGDALSENVNVCRTLERMASYLLTSDEIKKEEEEEKTKYVFFTDRKYFEKKVNRERSVEGMANYENGTHEESVIHFLKREEKNYRLNKTQTVNAEDLKREDWLGEILRDYNSLHDFVTNELKNKNSKYNRYLLTNTKGQVLNDMAYVKDSLLGVFGYDLKTFSEGSKPNYDIFNLRNEEHLLGKRVVFVNTKTGKETPVIAKGLLYFSPTNDLDDDFNLILLELQDMISRADLTYEEMEILEMMRSDMTQQEIAERIGTYQKYVSRAINNIVSKILLTSYDRRKAQ